MKIIEDEILHKSLELKPKDIFVADFVEAKKQLISLITKTEKVLLKLKAGTPQHTLSVRRLAAYKLAVTLMDERVELHGNEIQ